MTVKLFANRNEMLTVKRKAERQLFREYQRHYRRHKQAYRNVRVHTTFGKSFTFLHRLRTFQGGPAAFTIVSATVSFLYGRYRFDPHNDAALPLAAYALIEILYLGERKRFLAVHMTDWHLIPLLLFREMTAFKLNLERAQSPIKMRRHCERVAGTDRFYAPVLIEDGPLE